MAIYWNNHHHLLQAVKHVNGPILWANVHLLFWLSLFPFATGWMGENHFAALPVAIYGVVLFCAALYLVGIALAFWQPWLGVAVFAAVACIWLVPDTRIEKALAR